MANWRPGALRGYLKTLRGRKLKETATAYLFLLPASVVILVFGLWPVVDSVYVSLHKWNIRPKGSQCIPYWLAQIGLGSSSTLEKTDCLDLGNYAKILGFQSPSAVLKMLLAFTAGALAYGLLRKAMNRKKAERSRWVAAIGLGVVAVGLLVWSIPALVASGDWTYLASVGLVLLAWPIWQSASHAESTTRFVLRLVGACAMLSGAAVFFFVDFQRMWELGSQELLNSIIRTVFYSMGTVPVQLSVSLVLAYVLFQGIKGQGLFRVLYFLPYIAPTVATSVVFKRIFSMRENALANQFVGLLGLPPLKWLNETKPILPLLVELANGVFGTRWVWPDIQGPWGVILSGPSLALTSIMIYNWWVYVGYDTVVYLAGLSSIPHDLYEAASMDGAGKWTIFRHITVPLLSPTIFFLAIMATIGTFKAFNSIWVMYEQAARDTVDTTSILVFRTFRSDGQFGLAAAMAFVLFGIILALSEVQRRVGERLVFYG